VAGGAGARSDASAAGAAAGRAGARAAAGVVGGGGRRPAPREPERIRVWQVAAAGQAGGRQPVAKASPGDGDG